MRVRRRPKFRYSVIETLAEIKDFVRHCQKDPLLAGFDVLITKNRTSVVIAKTEESFMAKYVLPIPLDYADPLQRPLIANAIREAMTGTSMTAEEMENEMVCKSDPD